MNFPVLFTTSQIFINLTILRRRHAFLRHTLPPATHRPSRRSRRRHQDHVPKIIIIMTIYEQAHRMWRRRQRRRRSAFWWRRSFYNNIFVYKFVYILYFVYIFIYICKFQRFIATLHFYIHIKSFAHTNTQVIAFRTTSSYGDISLYTYVCMY